MPQRRDVPRYQEGYSAIAPIVLDREYKAPKVRKVLAVLEAEGIIGHETDRSRAALDIGCSSGQFAAALVPYFETVLGFDIDVSALAGGKREAPEVGFVRADSMRLPLADESVDLVVCNHTYEHVPDSGQLFSEIRRILRPEGACYLGAASRLTPIEPHYKLPFLSWLPKWLAHRYMRWTGKGQWYYENLRTWWGIKRLIRDFAWTDYTAAIIADPDRFHARDLIPRGSWISRVPKFVVSWCFSLLPSYILILRRKR